MLRSAYLLVLVGLAAVSACDCGSGQPKVADSPQQTAAAPAPAEGWGTVEGSIRLAEGAGVPAFEVKQMERKVLEHTQRAALPEVCTPPKTIDRQPVRLTAAGLLSGVMVAASGFTRQKPRAPATHEVIIEDCRLAPRMIVATRGDSLTIRNTVDYPFMPSFGATSMVRTMTKGQSATVTLDKGGVTPVLCGFTAPCGRADVVVVAHGLHAVSNEAGTFRIENVPSGQLLKIHAWHPLFKEGNAEVTLAPGETKAVELIMQPASALLVPAAEPTLAGPDAGAKAAAEPKPATAKNAAEPAAAGKQTAPAGSKP